MFPRSTYILVQKAMVYYLERQYDDAERLFEEVLRRDPYRLEHMDAYSNILYVHEKDAELSFLAHNAIKWDRYRPETCCIIGNYYSRKRQHEKAVQYFTRAISIDKDWPGRSDAFFYAGTWLSSFRCCFAVVVAVHPSSRRRPRA